MNVSLYLDRGSWVHHLDGRTKALSILGLFVLTLVFSDPLYLIGVTVMVMLGVVCVSIGCQRAENLDLAGPSVCVQRAPVAIFCGWTYPFNEDWKHGMLTQESVAFGVGMGLRLDLMVISGLLLLSTTTVEDFAFALQRLGLPSSMGFAFSLAFRWIPDPTWGRSDSRASPTFTGA